MGRPLLGLMVWMWLGSTAVLAQTPQTPIELTWNQNTESDLAGYRVYRWLTACPQSVDRTTLAALATLAEKAPGYRDAAIPPGTQVVCYGVTAYDTAGNESNLSNLVSKTLVRPAPVELGHWTQPTDVPHAAPQNVQHYTLHALVRPKATLTGFQSVALKNYTYMLYGSTSGRCGDGAVYAHHVGGGKVCDPAPLTPFAWTALTVVYDGQTLQLYRDSVLVGSAPSTPPRSSTESFQVGKSKFGEVCQCDLEVWLYDQAMTKDEVSRLTKAPVMPAIFKATPGSLTFKGFLHETSYAPQSIAITNAGTGPLTWTAATNQPWLTVSPTIGQGAGTLTVSVARGALPVGTHLATITLQAQEALPVSIAVTFKIEKDTTAPLPPRNVRLVS